MQQTLPTEFNTSSTLADVAPILYGNNVGAQTQYAQDNNDALQRAFQGEQDFEGQKRPIELGNLQATGDLTRATMGHTNAMTRASNLQSDIGDATKDSQIGATNAGNKTKMSDAELSQMENEGGKMGQIAAHLKVMGHIPAIVRAQYVQQSLGLPQEAIQGLMDNMPQLPDMLEGHSNNAFMASREARKLRMQEDAAQERTNTQTEAQKAIENAKIEAGKYNKKQTTITTEQSIDKLQGAAKKFAALNDAATVAEQNGDPDAAERYRARAEALRAQAMAELQSGGTSDIVIDPATGKPRLGVRARQVELGGGTGKPKPGSSADNPIILK